MFFFTNFAGGLEDKTMRTLSVPDRMLGSLTATLDVIGQNTQLAELQMRYAADIEKYVVNPFESFLVAQQQLVEAAENSNVQLLVSMKALVDDVRWPLFCLCLFVYLFVCFVCVGIARRVFILLL